MKSVGITGLCGLALLSASVGCGSSEPGIPGSGTETPGTPVNAARSITITPNTALSDGQQVTVAGSGFPRNATWHVAQCPMSATQFHECANHLTVLVDDDGTFSVPLTVSYVLGTHPCDTPQSCKIAAGRLEPTQQGFFDRVEAAVAFNSIAEPRSGSLLVEPTSTRVTDRIEITGAGWTPFAPVTVELAPAGGSGELWKTLASREGKFSTSFLVASATRNGGDCTAAPGACLVSAHDDRDPSTLVSVALMVLPPPQKGDMQVDPAGPFAGGETVRLTGSGWSPNRNLALNVCLQIPGGEFCAPSGATPRGIVTDASGSFGVDQVLPTNGSPSNQLPVPCAGTDKPYQLCHFVILDVAASDATKVRVPIPYGS
jgi:hypothetical protein